MTTTRRHPVFDIIDMGKGGKEEMLNRLKGGGFDSEIKSTNKRNKKAIDLCLSLWASSWRRRRRSLVVTSARERAWNKAMIEGWRPSDFARGIVGMTHDPWEDRDLHCDWIYILRSLDKWLDLYEKAEGRAALRRSALEFPTKVIGGVVVPADYRWENGDSFCKNAGERFDPVARSWCKPGTDRFDCLSAVNASQTSTGKEAHR